MSVVHHNHYEFAYLVEVVFEVIPITIVIISLLPVMHHFVWECSNVQPEV